MRKYGLPYQGSKSRYAETIIELLPRGERLVDLFAGGGAISHCAALSGKYKRVLFNDLNPLCVEYMQGAISGKWTNEETLRHWVSRDEFYMFKNSDPMIKWCWSFGNVGRSYLYGKDIEPIKKAIHEVITGATIHDRRLAWQNVIKLLENNKHKEIELQHLERLERFQRLEKLQHLEHLQRLEQLQHLQRLEQLQHLQRLQQLEYSSIDYRDYEYQDGDVVYCDPPYEPITPDGRTTCNDYGLKFDHQAFYDWVHNAEYPVYFSSYDISDNRFEKIIVAKTRSSMAPHSSRKNIEYLYGNRKFNISEQKTWEEL